MKRNHVETIRALNLDYLRVLNSREYRTGNRLLHSFDVIKRLGSKSAVQELALRFGDRRWRIDNAIDVDTRISALPSEPVDGRFAIYTCVTGHYDSVQTPAFISPNADYFCVSDEPIHDDVWRWIDAKECKWIPQVDNIRRARYVKTHPHKLFDDSYEYSIWIDGNCRPFNDITCYAAYLKNAFFASSRHPLRDCIYDEANICKFARLDDREIIQKQIGRYQAEGMPAHYGLFETNFIIRNHADPRCINVMEDWWREIRSGSRRDQLSLTYVMWKNGLSMDDMGVIPVNVASNPDFRLAIHRKKRF